MEMAVINALLHMLYIRWMISMAHPAWVIRLIMKGFPKRFSIARLSRWPLIGAIIERALFENDDMICLPEDSSVELEVGEAFDIPESMVLPSAVADHFVNRAKHLWIMNWCICRKSMGCKEYPVELGCLFLGEATIRIDPRLGRPASREEALEHLRKCRAAGLVQMVGKNKLDASWLDVKPSERLMTICNCCECCCLWKMLPHLSGKISSKVTKMPGVSVTVNDRCLACGSCVALCFVGAIAVVGGRAHISDDCRGCGRCAAACPNHAISVTYMGSASAKLAIERLSSSVTVD